MPVKQFPGEAKEHISANSILEEDHCHSIPFEFLNELKSSGLPDHRLMLKPDCPVMLLRNLQAGPNSKYYTHKLAINPNPKDVDKFLKCS